MSLSFEWDEAKRLANLVKHGIDFVDAKEIWVGDLLLAPSPKTAERRYIVYGVLENRIIAVVFTSRGQTIRLISARRALMSSWVSFCACLFVAIVFSPLYERAKPNPVFFGPRLAALFTFTVLCSAVCRGFTCR